MLASASGLFTDEQESDKEEILTIDITWSQFLAAMKTNNRSEMNTYIDVTAQTEFEEIFDALGADVVEIAEQIRAQKPFYVSGDVAVYLLEKQGDDGGTYIHTITFKRQSDGAWKLYQL